MARRGSRFSPRHLLALCTFLVPLGLLGWFGAAELTRQGEEAQATLMTKAIAFLNSAERAMSQHFDQLLAEALGQSVQAMETTDPALTGSLAAAVRDMREKEGGVPEALDLLLLDEEGGLMAPKQPPEGELGLPFSRPTVQRARGDNALALGAAETLALRGEYAQARTALQALEHAMPQRRTGTQGQELPETEGRLHFQLGGVERKLRNIAAAREHYERVRQVLAPQRVQRNADLAALDLLAEVALAELAEPDDGAAARLVVMQEIADGNRDELADGLLQSVMERLLDGVPEEAREREKAIDARRNDDARRHSRTFAAEYESTHVQAVRKRLRQAEGDDRPVYYAFGAGGSGSLLAIRRATADEEGRHLCSYVCLRLDLTPMLADFINDYLKDYGRGFVLAVEDGDGVVVAGTRTPPAGFDLPERQNHGLSLIAQPTNVDALVRNTEAAARNRGLLIATLFAVALGGAFWLWRSVTRAADLAATKVDFVSRVSHELKTPLALIRMYGETLGMGRAQGEGQVQRFGGIVAREADRLTTMIQRILDFSRQQSGTLTYVPVPTDLREQLQGIADAYLPHLQAKGASLHTELAAGLFANVDQAALESAVVNLLENAIKYQATDAPDSRIDLVLSAAGKVARIDVMDRGRGVPEAERHRIFDSFYRATNAGEVRGAGLGLSLVLHFAEAHGGKVASLPREGQGSIFRLELPLLPTGP